MANNGNIVPQGLLSNLQTSFRPSGQFGLQTTTPATQGIAPAPSAPQIGPSSLGLLQGAGLMPKSQTITTPDGSSHTMTYHKPDTTVPLGSAGNPQTGYHPDPLIAGMGAAKTPEQIAAAAAGVTSGPGSVEPVTVTPGSLGTGTPSAIGANQTPTGLLGNMIGQSQGILQGIQKVTDPFIQQNLDTIQKATQEEEQLTAGSYSGTAADYSGRLAQLENIKQAAQANVNAQQANLGTFSGQAQSAFGTGLGAATQQVQAPYGTPLLNPLTGTYSTPGGTTGGGNLDPQSQGTQLAQQVLSGQMDFQTALSQMGSYGAAGAPALRNAILAKNPNFNFNLSASSASTQAQGQQLNTQVSTANQALDSLGQSFAALSGLQTGGIPATNSIAQWIGTELGDQALSKYKSNLADARAQLVGVLNAAGGTPTGNEATAMQYLPDNMTPAMFQANVGTAQNPGIVRTLMQQKAQTFTGSGQQQTSTNTPSSTTGATTGWASLGD